MSEYQQRYIDFFRLVEKKSEKSASNFEDRVFYSQADGYYITGKQIKDNCRYIINLLIKQDEIIVSIGKAINDNNYGKHLKLSQKAFEIIRRLRANKFLSTIIFDFVDKKSGICKRPWNQKTASKDNSIVFLSHFSHSPPNAFNQNDNFVSQKLLCSVNHYKRKSRDENREEIGNVNKDWRDFRAYLISSPNHTSLVLQNSRNPHYLKLVGKAKPYQPLVVEISKNIGKLLDKYWLSTKTDDNIAILISITKHKISQLKEVMEFLKYKKKTYDLINENNKYKSYYCSVLGSFGGNVKFATNKLCGKISKENLPQRKKLMSIWKGRYDCPKDMHNFEDWSKYDTAENIAKQKQKSKERAEKLAQEKKRKYFEEHCYGATIVLKTEEIPQQIKSDRYFEGTIDNILSHQSFVERMSPENINYDLAKGQLVCYLKQLEERKEEFEKWLSQKSGTKYEKFTEVKKYLETEVKKYLEETEEIPQQIKSDRYFEGAIDNILLLQSFMENSTREFVIDEWKQQIAFALKKLEERKEEFEKWLEKKSGEKVDKFKKLFYNENID